MTDTYDRSLNSIYDSLYQAMDARKRAELQAAVLESARDSFETLLDEYERIPYNEHRFQSFIRAAFLKAMALVGEEPEASEWMRYLYDLWNDRAPGAGRNDGGWFTGTGYFNASCDTLFTVPCLLGRYTVQLRCAGRSAVYRRHPKYFSACQPLAVYVYYSTLCSFVCCK